jgi:hypothetical protein
LVPAWGETDAYTNRYHELVSRSKQAAGVRTDQMHARGGSAEGEGLMVVALAIAGLVLSIGPPSSITFGQPDGTRHPKRGALLAD